MSSEDLQCAFSSCALLPRRLNFSDSDEPPTSPIPTSSQESPKTPPNYVEYTPPLTPADRKHKLTIPLKFANHLVSTSKDLFYTPPIKRIRVVESLTAPKLSKLIEIKNSFRSTSEKALPKTKLYSINPFSPVANDLRKKWKNNNIYNNNDNNNNNNELLTSDCWIKDLTNLNLSDLQIRRYLKEFEVEELIGKGDFGEVYKCINMLEGMPYAIKKTLTKVVGTRRENYARQEVYANAALVSHPNIVAYHSAWNEGNSIFIQLEYCDGGNLDDMIFIKRHNFNDAAAERLLSHLANGLHYMHASKLVHLDIKPVNIMISHCKFLKNDEDKVDGDVIYKIGDLGRVAHVDNLSDVEYGDARYLPKEMLSGKYDSSTVTKVDLFSLGMTVYEAVSALRLPSDGPHWHILRDRFVPKIEGFRLNSLLGSMIDPDPLNRPNAIDVYKNVTLKASKLSEISTLRFKRLLSQLY